MRIRQTAAIVSLPVLLALAVGAGAQTQPQGQPPLQPAARAGVTQLPTALPAPTAAPTHRGHWLTEGGKSRVEVSDCPPGICAKIIWLKEPNDEKGKPLHDGYNKIKALNSRPILGLPLFDKMVPTETGWEGQVYNPEEGESFDVTVWMSAPDKLSIKGCVLFICQTHNWTRAPLAPTPAATITKR